MPRESKSQSKRKSTAQGKPSQAKRPSKPTSTKGASNRRQEDSETPAWISKRSGTIVIFLAGLIVGVITGWQTVPAFGWGEGLLWAAAFGGSIWVIGLGAYWLNRLFRGR